MDTSVNLGQLKLKNPVLTASGCFGYGQEFEDVMDFSRIGGIVTKGISLRPRAGNPTPRMAETYGGMLNSIGLQNVGLDAFLAEKLPKLKRYNTSVIVNVFGETKAEYLEIVKRLNDAKGISAIEVNISCPNVEKGGMQFGTDPDTVYALTKAMKKRSRLPIIIKLTPNVTDITVVAKAAEEGGADILSLINTLKGMAVNIETGKPILSTVYGGLSGPAIKPVALAMVHQVYRSAKVPIIGMGGIMTASDAIEFMLAGACAVQIGTANFIKADIAGDIAAGICEYMKRKKLSKSSDMIGAIHR